MGSALKISAGDVFNQLTVVEEVQRSTSKKRQFLCLCLCGTETIVVLGDLKNGHTKSCGCQGVGVEFHGESTTPLYLTWRAMKSRALSRGSSCNVYPLWENSFIEFKKWAESSGYTTGLCLCRTNDFGDYKPSNVRWDTRENNTIEAKAFNWKVESPLGQVFQIYNLSKFCRENKLSQSEMSRISKNLKTYKGWKCIKLNKGE